MRLDLFLFESNLTDSRTDAKHFILNGSVMVNGKVVKKPSFDVGGEENITVDKSSKKYVSRGGLKLEAAVESFKIDVKDAFCLDIGASSGGFTDYLLQNGAKHVIAVDSGFGQMVEKLLVDPRVTLIENYNARYMSPEDLDYIPNLVVMDVSFISAKMIFNPVYSVLAHGGDYVCLIKPQFEVGKNGLNKKGVVKNDKLRQDSVEDVISFACVCGFEFVSMIESPIIGGDGNIEYLAHFKKR